MGLFSRFSGIAKAEAHAVADKLEDPVKMTEQGIRDLNQDLQGAVVSLAEVKTVAIQARKRHDTEKQRAQSYVAKVEILQGKGDDELAGRALVEAQKIAQDLPQLDEDAKRQESMVATLQSKVNELRRTIQTYENELKTLKARAKTAKATEKINKQMAQVDSSSTIAMLEKMRTRVDEQEARAEAYADLASSSQEGDLDKELVAATAGEGEAANLGDLKSQLGM